MAASGKRRARPNYKALNELSLVDLLHDTLKPRKKHTSKVYTVERVISERQGKKVSQIVFTRVSFAIES